MNLALKVLRVVAVTALITANSVSADPAPDAEARRRADDAAQALTAALMPRLTAAIARGGPVEAVGVCSEIAQSITVSVGGDLGLVVKRTSLRLRNPANAPDAYERGWLERAASTQRTGKTIRATYEVLARPDGSRELRHLRPILFPGGVCAGCHGTENQVSSEVKALLAERYPDDEAVGFRPGDLRGAISVRVPMGPETDGSPEDSSMSLQEALTVALDDERKAGATYAKVIETHGEVRPFVHIVEAESRHAQALAKLFRAHGLAVPANDWPARASAPATVREACRQAVAAERENVALYAGLLAATREYPDVQRVFTRLRDASQERHLPAFERCVARGGTR